MNNAGGTVPAPHAESIPELVQRIQGAPRSDDEFARTALFHAFAVQMQPEDSIAAENLLSAYIGLNRMNDARAEMDRADKLGINTSF